MYFQIYVWIILLVCTLIFLFDFARSIYSFVKDAMLNFCFLFNIKCHGYHLDGRQTQKSDELKGVRMIYGECIKCNVTEPRGFVYLSESLQETCFVRRASVVQFRKFLEGYDYAYCTLCLLLNDKSWSGETLLVIFQC